MWYSSMREPPQNCLFDPEKSSVRSAACKSSSSSSSLLRSSQGSLWISHHKFELVGLGDRSANDFHEVHGCGSAIITCAFGASDSLLLSAGQEARSRSVCWLFLLLCDFFITDRGWWRVFVVGTAGAKHLNTSDRFDLAGVVETHGPSLVGLKPKNLALWVTFVHSHATSRPGTKSAHQSRVVHQTNDWLLTFLLTLCMVGTMGLLGRCCPVWDTGRQTVWPVCTTAHWLHEQFKGEQDVRILQRQEE